MHLVWTLLKDFAFLSNFVDNILWTSRLRIEIENNKKKHKLHHQMQTPTATPLQFVQSFALRGQFHRRVKGKVPKALTLRNPLLRKCTEDQFNKLGGWGSGSAFSRK